VARRLGSALIWHLRDILPPGGARRVLLWGARALSPRIICISQAVRASLPDNQPQARVIHNGVALERFRPQEPSPALREQLGLADGDRVLAIVSRLTPWKGHRTLLEALPRVAAAHPTVRLLVVGEPAFWTSDYAEELAALAEALGLADRVLFLGRREDVPELLALSEMLVLPSEDEPFGRVIVEAMAMGLPVVATATGGVPEIVVPEETGLLVPPRDPPALAEAVVTLLDDPERSRAMGQAGRERVSGLFDADATARRVQDVYGEIL